MRPLFLIGLMLCCAASSLAQAPPQRRFAAATAEEAKRWQAASRSVLLDLLKMKDQWDGRSNPATFLPFHERRIRTNLKEKYTIHEIEINSTVQRRLPIVLTIPNINAAQGKYPAVVCIHGHGGTRFSVYEPQGPYRAFAQTLAEKGFATISVDVGQHKVHEEGRTLMGERLWDLIRAYDYLARRADVDAERIGCAGLSLGGEMAMWLGAMEPGIGATVSSGFLTTVANMREGHCPCWDFPGFTEAFDFSDIYSLIAPRPLLCQIGKQERAPGGFPPEIAQAAMKGIDRAYGVLSAKGKAELEIHPEGHVFIVPTGVAFLEKHLKP